MIKLNQHPTFRELCDTVHELERKGSLTVDEALDAFDRVVHLTTRVSSDLGQQYPAEVNAHLAKQFEANRESKAEGPDNGPGAA